MKNFKLNIAYLAIFAMIFTSCSKEEAGVQNTDSEKATLSFGALLNELTSDRAATKGHVGFLDGVPECSEGTAAYVEIILSRDGVNVVGDDGEGNAYRVGLVDGQMFTEEDSALELVPGNYSLDYFAVFTADGTMIWIAPMGGGDDDNLSNFVDNPLPLAIDLRAGVKKYIEVDVLCYDDRFVNEYGYLFFEIDENEAIKFCIFGNYCDEDGRHYPASYRVSVWSGDSSSGTALYTDVPNVTGTYDNGDFYAEPVCFALPDTEGEEEYYFEITLLDSDAYGDVTEEVIRSGVITDAEVRALNVDDDTTEYYHFREGNCIMGDVPDLLDDPGNGNSCDPANPSADCDDDGTLNRCDVNNPSYGSFDCDGDSIINSEDNCPTVAGVSGPAGENGCPGETSCVFEESCDIENVDFPCLVGGYYTDMGFVRTIEVNNHQIVNPDTGVHLGTIKASRNENGNLVLKITPVADFSLSGYVIEIHPVDADTNEMSETCREFACNANAAGEGASETFVNVEQGEVFYIRVKAWICPPVLP